MDRAVLLTGWDASVLKNAVAMLDGVVVQFPDFEGCGVVAAIVVDRLIRTVEILIEVLDLCESAQGMTIADADAVASLDLQ